MELQELRGRMDEIDRQMADLFAQRMRVAGEIAEAKREGGLAVQNEAREQQVQTLVAARVGGELAPYAAQLYQTMFALSRDYQRHLLCGETAQEHTIKEASMQHTLSHYQAAADYIKRRAPFVPELAIVLGSCLGPFAAELTNPVAIPYADIPNFLLTTVESHAGELIFGTVRGKRVVCMSGRFHFYEGYDYEQLATPVRVLKLLGVRALILTNAAGAVNTNYRAGDVMILSDHIKLTGASPLRGPNIEAFGPRFFDMTKTYTPALREIARACAENSSLAVHEGVYMFFTGPQFETPAEIRAARLLGADAVGMSTVTEALTAAHCGLPLLALSVMTNMAAGVLDQPLSAEEVGETAARVAAPFSAYVKDIIERI